MEKQNVVSEEVKEKESKDNAKSQEKVSIKDKSASEDPKTQKIEENEEIVETKEKEKIVEIKEKEESIDITKYQVVEMIPTKTEEKAVMNQTSLLMNESAITVPDSPNASAPKDATFSPEIDKSIHDSRPHISTIEPVKDSTFSPVIDKSINDSRPHIEMETELNTTPIFRNIQHRSSTPLAQRIMKRETPKPGTSAITSLVKVLSPKIIGKVQLTETLNDTLNGQFKMINQHEKSILKSTRKRSLSVTDGETMAQKRVMFISPKVMDIGEIDEKMLQSFREEKENSILKLQQASGSRRKRSLSASELPARKTPQRKDMPDFKAIHEARFKKMESIVEHEKRKADRAKRLVTPSKSLPVIGQVAPNLPLVVEKQQLSKIPTRKPLTKISQIPQKRTFKRSKSADQNIAEELEKPVIASKLPQRSLSQDKPKIKFTIGQVKTSTTTSTATSAYRARTKVEDRREKNMSLHKSNVSMRGNAGEIRKKNDNLLKGVRLNRRFELQMQHRANEDHHES